MNDAEKLKEFVLENINRLSHSGGSGAAPKLPSFDLYGQDYLGFAEKELLFLDDGESKETNTRHRINCISHLKRALDCQIDTFLHVFNLSKVFRSKNLGIDAKLKFLQASGIYSSRSISRLTNIRNRMEHDFELPDIQDIEIFFDLVASLVAILQRALALTFESVLEMYVDVDNERMVNFCMEYSLSEPQICVELEYQEESCSLIADLSDPSIFAYFFKVHFLLTQLESFASTSYLLPFLEEIVPI